MRRTQSAHKDGSKRRHIAHRKQRYPWESRKISIKRQERNIAAFLTQGRDLGINGHIAACIRRNDH